MAEELGPTWSRTVSPLKKAPNRRSKVGDSPATSPLSPEPAGEKQGVVFPAQRGELQGRSQLDAELQGDAHLRERVYLPIDHVLRQPVGRDGLAFLPRGASSRIR